MTNEELKNQLLRLGEKVRMANRQETLEDYFNQFMRLISHLPTKDYNYIKSPVNISQRLMDRNKYNGEGLEKEIKYAISMIPSNV